MRRYVHPLNTNTPLHRLALFLGQGDWGVGRRVRSGNVPVNNNANRFLFLLTADCTYREDITRWREDMNFIFEW